MEFTFGVITYNSEKFVIETLESIRYQVENYGKDHRTTLVVSDDGSKDGTIMLVEKWLEKYRGLFFDVKVLTVEKNTGVTHNYVRALKEIKDDCCKVIAGDDLISSFNIYEQFNKANPENMNIYLSVMFRDGSAYIEEDSRANMFYFKDRKHTNKNDIHLFEVARKPFHTPEACLRRRFFDEGCINEIERYTQFEDDPSEYYILQNNSSMVYDFMAEPNVLYRIHGAALSHGGTSLYQIQFLDDMHVFNKHMLKTEKNIFYKCAIFLKLIVSFRMKHRFGIEHTLHGRLCSHIMKKRTKSVKKNPAYADFVAMLNKQVENENKFLAQIRKQAEAFEKSLGEV